MDLKSYEIERFTQLPDIHGALYDAIEEFKPKSHQKLENDIKSFLDYVNPENIEKNPPVSASMLIAPWGLGKTTTYDVIIKDLLKSDEFNGIPIKIRAQDISNYYDTFKDNKNFKLFPSNADRYLYLLSKLLLQNDDLKSKISDDVKSMEGSELINGILSDLQNTYNFFIIFIDELEEVVKNKNEIIPFILKSTKDLLNDSSKIINSKTNRNFLSFILACTDAAYYEVSRSKELEYQFGGINRRIQEITIDNISLEECVEYLAKLNKFCYNGKFINSFLNPGASFNTIARMAMKNPGHMKSLFTILMNKSASLHSASLIYQIDGNFILNNCQNYKLEYMETQRKSLGPEIYANWLKKFKDDPIILGLISIFIGELRPFTIQELIKRFDKDVAESTILSKISLFNEYINSIHSNIRDAILPVRQFNVNFTSADLQNILKGCGYNIETSEDFITSINFKLDGLIPLNDFLENLTYFEIDKDGKVSTKFIFTTDLEILRQQLFPYLSNTTISTLRSQFKKHLKEDHDNFILNPTLFNLIFPLPIPKEYNILDDKNENVRIWTEISTKRKSEIYRKDICSIISSFLITNNLITESSSKNIDSLILNTDKFSFFDEIQDFNQFLILNNFFINDISSLPINLMIWREVGDYNSSIMNDITQKIELFQKNKKCNIHILLLVSQNKIQEELLSSLRETLEFTIAKETPLSQFDITKFSFLNEIYQNFRGKYEEKKFKDASKLLIGQFNEVILSVKEDVDIKGLNIKLNVYTSTLSEIPQLMKHILFDFETDFSNWTEIVIKKPYEKINPIGLAPRYSSSLDDWSEERLKTSISDYLLINGFVDIQDGALIVSMPKIEKSILNLIKQFQRDGILFKVDELKEIFFDLSRNPNLFRDIFIADLENRGLIELNTSTREINLVEIDETLIKQKFDELKRKLKNLKLKDRTFYHVYTIKQQGYSLILLDDFLNVLESLMNLEECNNSNEHFKYTKFMLFIRIFDVFEQIINRIFLPMEVKISKLNKELDEISSEKINADFVELKLRDYGIENVDIKSFPEIKNYITETSDLKKNFYENIDKTKFEADLKFYHKIHKGAVNVQGEHFSYLKLRQNKLKSDFKEPYLNFLYFQIMHKLEKYENAPIIEKMNSIMGLINEIDTKYRGIESQITKVVIKDEKSLAFHVLKAVEKLSTFEFVKREDTIEDLNGVTKFLEGLIKEIDNINIPITRILKRASVGQPQSLIDKIFSSESEIMKLHSLIHARIDYCTEQKVCDDEADLTQIKESIENFDSSNSISEITKCSNLNELADQSDQILRDLTFEISIQKGKLSKINSIAYDFFKNFKDLDSLIIMFNSLGMKGYAKQCESYKRNISQLQNRDYNIDFKNIIINLLSLRARIEEGHSKILGEELSENALKLYQSLYEKFINKGTFTDNQLIKTAKILNISGEHLEKIMEELNNKKLIQKKFYFIS